MATSTAEINAEIDADLLTGQQTNAAKLRALLKKITAFGATIVDNNLLTDEQLQDKVADFLNNSVKSGISMVYDDLNNRMNITVPASMDAEGVQDIVGALLQGGANITVTYNDTANTLTIIGAVQGWTTVAASATSGTGVIACGTTPFVSCDVATSGNLTANITGSGRQRIVLKVTVSSAGHTLAVQYNGSASAVKLPGDVAQAFSTAAGSVYIFDCMADGTTLEVLDFVSRAAGVPSRRIVTVASMATSYTLDLSQADDTLVFATLTGSIASGSFTVTGAAKGRTFYMEVTQGGAGSFSIVFPTSSPNMIFPSTVAWNTTAGKCNTFSGVCSSATIIYCQFTRFL